MERSRVVVLTAADPTRNARGHSKGTVRTIDGVGAITLTGGDGGTLYVATVASRIR
jgi:hypothetical protein